MTLVVGGCQNYAHIGNFRTFLTADLIYQKHFIAVADHSCDLTVDDVADAEGEDRMEKALHSKAGEQFNNVWELSEYYADCLEQDWQSLNLQTPKVRPKATQHMREQIVAAEKLRFMNYK